MMKKIISISFLGVLILLTYNYLNKVFLTKHHYINTTESFKELTKESNIDVLIFGSSRAYRTFNPFVIDYYSNTLSFNLGSDALSVPFTSLVLEQSLKYNKPKLVIFEIHANTIKYPNTEEAKGFQLRALDFVNDLSIGKFKQTNKAYNFKEFMSVYSPLFRNHAKWYEVDFLNLSRTVEIKEHFHRGFFGTEMEISQTDKEKFKDFKSVTPKRVQKGKIIKEDEIKEVERFVTIAKKNGIEVLIVSAPSLRTPFENNVFFDELSGICKLLGINYLNFNDHFSEMDLQLNDFQDPGHLNIFGSSKASIYLADFINKNYKLSDRTTEFFWKEINQDFEIFESLYIDSNDSYFLSKQKLEIKSEAIVNSIKIIRNRRKHLISLYLIDFENFKSELDKYKMGVHIFPVEKDMPLLNARSKSEGWKFELADFYLKGQSDSIYFEFNSSIRNIDRIEMFLYDESGFKGVIGNKIAVKNIVFE